MTNFSPDFLNSPVEQVAPRLLGSILERELDGDLLRVRIVETEAYDQSDVASHSYNGETPRTKVMFGPPGHLYVYFTYGMHYCCNIVVGSIGHGAAVLLRALEPITGEETMFARRRHSGKELANGSAKLCQALGIDKTLNGHNLQNKPLQLIVQSEIAPQNIITTPRIGISKGKEVPWRFYIRDNPYVS